jgi:hypothetical protein
MYLHLGTMHLKRKKMINFMLCVFYYIMQNWVKNFERCWSVVSNRVMQNTRPAGCWWLTPVIITTKEADIRRIMVQSQPQANSSQDPILKKPNTKKGWWSGSRNRP